MPPGEPAASRPALRSHALVKRLLTAAIGIPILWLAVKKGPIWLCFSVVELCAALAAREACALLRTPLRRPLAPLAMLGSVAVGIPFLFPNVPFALPIVGIVAAILLASLLFRETMQEKVEASIGTLFAVMFAGLPLGFITGLRAASDEEMGRDLVVLLLVVIWIGDTAAMYVGSLVGRHRLAPRLSPHKSIEGAVAGVAGAIGAAIVAHFWWFQRLPIQHAVAIGTLLGIMGIGGDLAESALKRAAGAKDSSSILPGHGGFLDRIDSLLFASPALYYYYQALLH